VFGNAITGATLGGTCQQWALHTTPAGIVFTIIALMPLTIMPLALVFEGEKITRRSVIGAVIAVIGVIALIKAKM
jgi:drug/metabolite transporter (DMT)-like permease